MQNPSKIARTSTSTTTRAVYELQGWADLPEGLLHSVVPRLGYVLEVLAFAGTCRSWRAAFSSYPSKSTLCSLLPPLLVQPHITVRAPNLPSKSDDGHKLGTCQVLDPANMKSTLRCQVPEATFENLHFAGCSYGQLMCGLGDRNFLVMDVFTGAQVLPPQLPFCSDHYCFNGMLTAPLASHNSHLLVSAPPEQGGYCLLDWLIGSDSWSKLQVNGLRIEQIVEFSGQFIVMDSYHHRIYTLSLAPQLGLQEIATVRLVNMLGFPLAEPWLVVCSGMLLIVDYYINNTSSGAPVKFKAYSLDMSTEPATWVEVVKLEDDALFMGRDIRSPTFSCLSPGRWGGRSNCLYYAHNRQPWILHGLGDDADAVWDDSTDPDLVYVRGLYLKIQPF